MTTIRRRTLPRYAVVRTWCQEHQRTMWSVIDRRTATWAPGTKAEGYDNQADAEQVLARLIGDVK